jgi:hypothetical protein
MSGHEEIQSYNKICPAHNHTCWAHRHLMREDDLICTKDYKRLSGGMKKTIWNAKSGIDWKSNLSIVVDWLLEHPLKEDIECEENKESRADRRLKEEALGLTDSWRE